LKAWAKIIGLQEIEELKTRMEAMSKAFELYLLVSDGENKKSSDK